MGKLLLFVVVAAFSLINAKNTEISGEYLVQVNGACDQVCHDDILSSARSTFSSSCIISGPHINLHKKTLLKLVCRAVVSANQVPSLLSKYVQSIKHNEAIILLRKLPLLPCTDGDITNNIENEITRKKKDFLSQFKSGFQTMLRGDTFKPRPMSSPCVSESPSSSPTPSSTASPSTTPSKTSSATPSATVSKTAASSISPSSSSSAVPSEQVEIVVDNFSGSTSISSSSSPPSSSPHSHQAAALTDPKHSQTSAVSSSPSTSPTPSVPSTLTHSELSSPTPSPLISETKSASTLSSSLAPSVSPSASSSVLSSPTPSTSTRPSASVSVSSTPSSSISATAQATKSPSETPIPRAIWNIDEIDGEKDGVYSCTKSNRGAGIHVLVIDTGCEPRNGGKCETYADYGVPGTCTDSMGHGTHVMGIIGDVRYGVAPKAKISCYKVFSNSGVSDTAALYKAFDFAIENNVDVINLSLGLPGRMISESLDDEVREIANYPKWVVNSAGNDNLDSCSTSPQRAKAATLYKVQAHNEDLISAGFTNYGSCTDLSAPGVDIQSLSNTGNSPSTRSGSSMAAPHVTGMIAQLLSDNIVPAISALTQNGETISAKPARSGNTIKTLGVNC